VWQALGLEDEERRWKMKKVLKTIKGLL